MFRSFALFPAGQPSTLATALISNPDEFMAEVLRQPDPLALEFAQRLDREDPLAYTANEFKIGDVIPFAGHSLGPLFKPAAAAIQRTLDLQASLLHDGHHQETHPEGKENAHWFDCDLHTSATEAAQAMLGFETPEEFIFTANGLTDNLGKVLDTLYRPGLDDWQSGKTKIAMLAGEFFSDQAVVNSVVKRGINWAQRFKCREARDAKPADHILRIPQGDNQLYSSETIIAAIKANADKLQIICLSDIVFMTGQRLDLKTIFTELKDVIEKNQIVVGLDLAHTVGNRRVDLAHFPVQISFAVGCAYKHLSGPAGSGFGLYVNRHINLEDFPPLQGWKAAASHLVFPQLNSYDDSIMANAGAVAFRTSNPPPLALHPVQTYLTYFHEVGFDKCTHKSEALTRYLSLQLRHQLGEHIEMITPEDPEQRGATLVFRLKDDDRLNAFVQALKEAAPTLGRFEVDSRAPNIRLTAHYGYTRFEQICRLVTKMKLIVENKLEHKQSPAHYSYYGV